MESGEVASKATLLSNSSNIVRTGSRFQRNILNMERGLRGYLITGERYFLHNYDSSKAENDVLIRQLKTALANDTLQTSRIKNIEKLYTSWVNNYAEQLKRIKTKDSVREIDDEYLKNNSVIVEEVGVNRDLQKKFNELINREYSVQTAGQQALIQSEEHTKTVSFLMTFLSILLVIIIAVVLERQISLRLKKMISMTESIGQGDYTAYVRDNENDELSELTQSLNNMTQQLDQHVSQLNRKNQELDQFANIVSHDLKAPLRGIENVVSWIEEDHKDELPRQVQEYISLIRGRISRAEKLIEGILRYTRIGKETSLKERTDTAELVNEIINSLDKSPNTSFNIQPDMPVFETEKVPLQQVFSNLITNAVKYNDSPDPQVKIYYHEQTNHYRFFVEDNGPGIAHEYHEKIFQIFQTLGNSDSYENTGIGLAIVKKILDERKEQVKLDSDPGKGSVFSFTWSKY